MVRSEITYAVLDLITHTAKNSKACSLIAFCGGWVVKAPVDALSSGGKHRTPLACIIANRNHVIELLSHKFINRFRAVAVDVNTHITHHLDCLWSDTLRFGACTEHFKLIAALVSK